MWPWWHRCRKENERNRMFQLLFIIVNWFIENRRWTTTETWETKDITYECSYWRGNSSHKHICKCGWFTTNAKHFLWKYKTGQFDPNTTLEFTTDTQFFTFLPCLINNILLRYFFLLRAMKFQDKINLQILTKDPFPVSLSHILHELAENFLPSVFANLFWLYRHGMLLVR